MKNFSHILLLAALSGTAISTLPPHVALAQEAGTTSQLTGITLPKGAATVTDGNDHFAGLLADLSKERCVKMSPASEDAEAYVWKDDNFKENRVPFMRTAVASKLTAAGYTVKEIDPQQLQEVNVFLRFDMSDHSLPINPSMFIRPVYFQAVNEDKGAALLGVWLQSQDTLALGLLPMEFKAKPKEAPLPDLGPGVVLVKDFHESAKGMTPLPLPSFQAIARKPSMARGFAKDGSGKPLVGVDVAVEVSAGGGFRTTHHARTNAQGLYEVLLPAGVAKVVEAKANISFNGQTLELFLSPVKGETEQFDAQAGHVDNFVLRSSGEYGANIRVLHAMPEGGTIEITVAPQGRQMDGSQGHTFVYRYASGLPTEETFLEHIPVGRYQISARYLEDGDALPLRVRRTFGNEDETQPQASLPVEWVSGIDAISGHFGKSHLRAFQVTLVP